MRRSTFRDQREGETERVAAAGTVAGNVGRAAGGANGGNRRTEVGDPEGLSRAPGQTVSTSVGTERPSTRR